MGDRQRASQRQSLLRLLEQPVVPLHSVPGLTLLHKPQACLKHPS